MKELFFVTAIVLMILFSGCTGQQEQAQDQAKTQATTGQTKAGTATTLASAGGGALDELMKLFTARPKEYTITYDVTTTSPESGAVKQEMTYYYKSQDRMRMDGSFEDESGRAVQSRIYILGKDMITCSDQEGKWVCYKFTGEEDTKTPEESMEEMEDNIASSSVTRIGDRVIAGMNARCYKLTMTLKDPDSQTRLQELGMDTWEGTYCISNDGTPLYSESKSEGVSMVMEAKTYRASVSESDLVPPAEVVDMQDLLKGMDMPETELGSETDMTLPEEYQKLLEGAGP